MASLKRSVSSTNQNENSMQQMQSWLKQEENKTKLFEKRAKELEETANENYCQLNILRDEKERLVNKLVEFFEFFKLHQTDAGKMKERTFRFQGEVLKLLGSMQPSAKDKDISDHEQEDVTTLKQELEILKKEIANSGDIIRTLRHEKTNSSDLDKLNKEIEMLKGEIAHKNEIITSLRNENNVDIERNNEEDKIRRAEDEALKLIAHQKLDELQNEIRLMRARDKKKAEVGRKSDEAKLEIANMNIEQLLASFREKDETNEVLVKKQSNLTSTLQTDISKTPSYPRNELPSLPHSSVDDMKAAKHNEAEEEMEIAAKIWFKRI